MTQRRLIRVVHLLDGRHLGGAEQMVIRLSQASAAIDVQAQVYCLSEGRLADQLRQAGVPLRVFTSRGRLDLSMLGGMRQALAADGAQILQAHTSRTHLMARVLSRWSGVPNITTIHSPIAADENQGLRRHPLRAWVERLGRRWTDMLTPVSQEETERLAREEGVPADKLTWIPNGLEPHPAPQQLREQGRRQIESWLSTQGLPAGTFVAAMVAQMRPRKGPEVLLRALAAWQKQGGQGAVLMVGGDEFTQGAGYLERLTALAAELDISQRVYFTGFRTQPWNLAAGADLCVLPSLFGEGLPLVLLEAMNLGIALAASDILGNREILTATPSPGWLFAPGDAGGLATLLARAQADRSELTEKGRAGAQLFARQYAMGQVLGRWRGCYEQLADKAPGVHL